MIFTVYLRCRIFPHQVGSESPKTALDRLLAGLEAISRQVLAKKNSLERLLGRLKEISRQVYSKKKPGYHGTGSGRSWRMSGTVRGATDATKAREARPYECATLFFLAVTYWALARALRARSAV